MGGANKKIQDNPTSEFFFIRLKEILYKFLKMVKPSVQPSPPVFLFLYTFHEWLHRKR